MSDKKFKPFWYESGLWFQMVNNDKDLADLLSVHQEHNLPKDELLDRSFECLRADPEQPAKFGLSSECRGNRTLRQFLDANGVVC